MSQIQIRKKHAVIRNRKKKMAAAMALAVFFSLPMLACPGKVYAQERPAYRRSATYVSDAWVINFWNTESDHMEEEMARIAADGFNSIILVIPWREFQPMTAPVTYNDYAFRKLDRVMRAAAEQGLWVELRVSYTWDYYEEEKSQLRFREMLGDAQVRQSWLDYVEHIYTTASQYPNFYGGFITWEDFWNYVEDAPAFGTGSASVTEAKRIGYQDYLEEHYDLEEVNLYYQDEPDFSGYQEIFIPRKSSPAYQLFYEFYDDFLIRLLADAQEVFPELSMEVRLDVDPVEGLEGELVGIPHYRTFACGSAPDTSLMYSVSMGYGANEVLSAGQAVEMMKSQLNLVRAYNGGKPIYIDQLLYMDETEAFSYNARVAEEERGAFLTGIPDVLRTYTDGYGIWCYRNYVNNPLYNCQFALGSRGWTVENGQVAERDGSSQICLHSGKLAQRFGTRLTGEATHDNHVRLTADSDGGAIISVTLGRVTKEVQVNGKKEIDLNFGHLPACNTLTISSRGEVYLDNIQVYNFVQDGQLYDPDGQELSCLEAMRALNTAMN